MTPQHPILVKPLWPWWLAVLLFGAALRAALLPTIEPMAYPDTPTYLGAAADLVSGVFSLMEGRRTPIYPLLIVLVGQTPQAIVVAQAVLGIGISLLLFFITWRLTARPGVACLVGLSYHLNLQQLLMEFTVLAETLATLGVAAVVAVWLLVLERQRHSRPAGWLLFCLGCLSGVTILTRPQFLFFLPLLPVLVVLAVSGLRWPTRQALLGAVTVSVPAVAMILAWCLVVFLKVGYFTMSTQSGFGLVNHSVAFIEDASPRYAVAREVLLKQREKTLAATGSHANTIWYAWPELRKATGWTLPEASREMQKMSTELILQHPVRYAVAVARGWVAFWTVPLIWELERMQPATLSAPLEALWWFEHKLLRLTNTVFLLLTAAVLVSARVRQRTGWDPALASITALILATSVFQALAEWGTNSRYAAPIQALVVLVVVVACTRWLQRRRSVGARAQPAAPARTA